MKATDLAEHFALGRAARLSDVPVARGKQGHVWRLDTADGRWAVKVPFHRTSEDEVRAATEFQEAAYACGVPTPRVCRTTEGQVFADIAGTQVRVYGWVDLLPPDPRLDPMTVGAVVAAIHRVPASGLSLADPWYHEPVGANRRDKLIGQLSRPERHSLPGWPACADARARMRPLRVRARRPGPGPRADGGIPGGRRTCASEAARALLHAHRAARSHH